MQSYFKKSKKESRIEQQMQDSALHDWRSKNVQLAIARDNGQCVFCWFQYGAEVRHSQVHHMYSRDRKAGGWREHYTNLICVCNEHHPPPIITPGGSKNLSWVEDVARQANETPINKGFSHHYTGLVTDG